VLLARKANWSVRTSHFLGCPKRAASANNCSQSNPGNLGQTDVDSEGGEDEQACKVRGKPVADDLDEGS
jgi:hypothetical protein